MPISNVIESITQNLTDPTTQLNQLTSAQSESECADAERLILNNAKLGLTKVWSEISAATGSNSALNLLVKNLLKDSADLLGAEFADFIREQLAREEGPAAYLGAAITTYITTLAIMPNVVMAIPYLLVYNLKKYLRIRIESVLFIKSVISDIETILRSIPIDTAPSERTLRELRNAVLHLKKCLQFLNQYKNRVIFTTTTATGYVSPSLFHRGVQELDAAISDLHGNSSPLVVDTLSDEEIDAMMVRYFGDNWLAEFATDPATPILLTRQIFRAYIRKYGVTYFLVLRLIKKLEPKPNSVLKNLLNGKQVFDMDSINNFDPKHNLEEAAATASTPEKFISDYPLFAVILTTPIIETYITALSKILDNLKLIEGLSPNLQHMLGAMFAPMNLSTGRIEQVKNALESKIQGRTSLTTSEAAELEFSKIKYIADLEASKLLLWGMDTKGAGQPGGAAVIADTANLLSSLNTIQTYINSDLCVRGADHPISDLDSQIFSLIPKLLSVLTDVNNRKNITSQLIQIKKTCQRSVNIDSRLLSVLEGFNPENTAWFQEALNTYKIISSNLDLSEASNLVYSPVQINLGKQVGFGIIDGLLLGYVLLDSVVGSAIRNRTNEWVGIRTVGTTFTSAAETIFNCLKGDSHTSKTPIDITAIEQLSSPSTLDTLIKVNGTHLGNRATQLTQPSRLNDWVDTIEDI